MSRGAFNCFDTLHDAIESVKAYKLIEFRYALARWALVSVYGDIGILVWGPVYDQLQRLMHAY